MLKLKELQFFLLVMQKTQEVGCNPGSQMERLYNDAIIGLFYLGILPDKDKDGNLFYQIDDQIYPVSDFAQKIISKNPVKEENRKEVVDLGLEKITNIKTGIPDVQLKEETTKSQMKPFNVSAPLVVSKNRLKITNQRNPSEVEEFQVNLLPFSVNENERSTNIVVEVERNGKRVYFISQYENRKAVNVEMDGFLFAVRGAWHNGTFSSNIFLQTNGDNKWQLTKEENVICSESISEDAFTKAFVREIGDTKFYILPFDNVNEPNGKAKIAIAQIKDDARQVFCNSENVQQVYVDGNNYRIYAIWHDDVLDISIDNQGEC